MFEHANDSEWETPSFAKPRKKTNRVSFLTDLLNLNGKLERKPNPMQKIREMLLKLEGF